MKITLLLTQSLSSPGGAGRYWPLSKSLTKLGHQVTILAFHHDYPNEKKRKYIEDGITVHYVGQMHVRKIGNKKYYFNNFQLIWIIAISTMKLTWVALRTPADVIHVCKTQPMNGIAAWVAHLIRKTPIYLDSDDYESVNNKFANKWQQKIVAKFENWMPSFAQGITAGTRFISNHFQELGYPPSKIKLVHNGVDQERFAILEQPETENVLKQLKASLQLPNQAEIVVYVGSISLVSHAIDLLLQSFVLVAARNSNAHLVVVGAGEDFDLLADMVTNLGISQQVTFTGRIPLEQIPYYYRLGKISVDPMRVSLPAESSLSLKLLESIAATTPCITSDIGDRAEVVGKAGIAVTPDDPEKLAETILNTLENEDICYQMRKETFNEREKNWWDKRIQTFISVYSFSEHSKNPDD